MTCCRARINYVPVHELRPRDSSPGPCALILQAGNACVVERMGASLILKTPYSSGMGLGSTMTTLGCSGTMFEQFRELEITVAEVLTDPVRAAKFLAKLPTGLVTIGAVRNALSYTI